MPISITITPPLTFEEWVFLQAFKPSEPAPPTQSLPEGARQQTIQEDLIPEPVTKTHADLRDACRKARQRGVETAKILAAMGVGKVDDVPADKVASVVAAVEAL